MNGFKLFALSPLILSLASTSAFATEKPTDSLETIVVTATGSERSTLLAPASLSVITRDDLQNIGDQQLISALRKTAGISLSGRGVGGRKVIQLRGLESKHSLILIDGKRVSATDDVVGHSDFQYEWLPLDSIERIEVIRGPMSSLYGSEALGGVINIITRTGQQNASSSLMVNGTLDNKDVGGGKYSVNGQLVQPLTESVTFKAHLGHKNQDDVIDNENPRVSLLEGRRVNTAQIELDWTLNNDHMLDVEYLVANEERWQHTNYRGNEPYYRSWYDLKREQISTFWNANFRQWTGQVGYYRSAIDVINKNDSPAVSAYTPQFLTDNVFEARFHRDFGMSRLTLGGEWRDEELEHSAFNGGGDSAVHKSVLAQYETDLVDDVYLTLGGRWDHHEYFGGEFSPRAYLVWALTSNLSIKTGYGHGFKAPTLKQISPEYRFDGPHSFLGNEDLKPETSDSWEIGLRYESARATLSATAFHNNIDDLISTVCVENCEARFGHVNRYVNVEEAEVTGFEFESSFELLEPLQLTNSYTYTDGENKSSGQKLTSRPKHQGTIGVNIDWIPGTLSSSVDWQYIGKQYTASHSGMTQLPNYSIVNANLNYFIGDHRLTLSATNIGDTDLLKKSSSFGYQEHGRSIDVTWFWRL